MTRVHQLRRPVTDDWDWQLHAACRGLDTGLFYHPDNERGPSRTGRERAAKQICAGCPVIADCLKWALTFGEPHGVWGGLTVEERNEVRAGKTA